MIRRTSPTVRLLAWSRLSQSSTAARTVSFSGVPFLTTARFSAFSPAGSRCAATSPSNRRASVRAVSTVHGDPNGPMVILRSGAARPRPARYMRMKARAPFGLTRRPKPFTSPSQSIRSFAMPSCARAGPAVSHVRLVSF